MSWDAKQVIEMMKTGEESDKSLKEVYIIFDCPTCGYEG